MPQDVTSLLHRDHRATEALLARFDSTAPDDRAEYFCEVAHTLVAHEVAEEMVVYPALRQDAADGDEVADARLHEQAEAEEALAELRRSDPKSSTFTAQFTKLRDAVLAHAQAEEVTAFPLLAEVTTDRQRQELGARYEKAKESAPTHPHPHAPDTPPGNQVVGPIAALFDRARDAVGKV